MQKLYEMLVERAGESRVMRDEPMSKHTTFRVGGPADIIFFPANEDEILFAMEAAENMSVPVLLLGNGSNVIVKDKGVRGLTIILGEAYSDIQVDGETLIACAGATLAKLANTALEHSLTGLEFASGIPGTVGGGCAMNAGAYGGELSDCLVSARVKFGNKIVNLDLNEMQMGYRSTRPLREGGIVLTATFRLKKGDKTEIAEKMRDLNARRREKQPLNYPSAGSTFKRPTGYFAGALIEQSELKGYMVGGAQVSEKHAGFVINKGGATAADLLQLIADVQEKVKEKFGVTLETEVRIMGE